MPNSCVVKKRFLFWKYNEVEHEDELYSIRKFMYCSKDYIVEFKCKKCGRIRERSFVHFDELLLMGVQSEELIGVSTSLFFPQKPNTTNT